MRFDNNKKPKGFKRIVFALRHSLRALSWLIKNESAFKQEVTLLLVSLVALGVLQAGIYQWIAVIGATLFVMFAEILNTAIEVIVDRVGLDIHPLSGRAKDLGSAAVLVALIIYALVWVAVITAF
ncbi:diacylglycerol kinase [Pseudoalteromonas sp. SW0106-04]|uniref:diacylglycerol kinase n=1 Tax=Pseudoalteromonas sp. SW0106-04 TaxID=1702169 RepID=UPI0006B6430C|nr:diacylglycerol kinase [Pseudoalteromonas sp. SW0106-04]GAP73819.1 diacylglycerol kinase [Pseudoalteromonas sp. SW0106-04]